MACRNRGCRPFRSRRGKLAARHRHAGDLADRLKIGRRNAMGPAEHQMQEPVVAPGRESAGTASIRSSTDLDAVLEQEFGIYVQAASAPPPVRAFDEPVRPAEPPADGGRVPTGAHYPTSGHVPAPTHEPAAPSDGGAGGPWS
jgi:hypothetical protein